MDTSASSFTVRLIMPDRWFEHVVDLSPATSVADAKALGIREMLQRGTDDPADFYAEYAEREIIDESRSLSQIGLPPGGVLSIRAYDLGHNRRFEG